MSSYKSISLILQPNFEWGLRVLWVLKGFYCRLKRPFKSHVISARYSTEHFLLQLEQQVRVIRLPNGRNTIIIEMHSLKLI